MKLILTRAAHQQPGGSNGRYLHMYDLAARVEASEEEAVALESHSRLDRPFGRPNDPKLRRYLEEDILFSFDDPREAAALADTLRACLEAEKDVLDAAKAFAKLPKREEVA